MIINPFCADLGWLFSDIRQHFHNCPLVLEYPDLGILASETPTHADSWLAIRSWEAPLLQWPERSVIQIHALDPRLILGNHCEPRHIDAAAGLVFTHPEQPGILRDMGVSLEGKKCLLRPIGALGCFHTRTAMSDTPTFAWVGRDTGAKRTHLFCDAAEQLAKAVDICTVLVGEHLEGHFTRLATTVYNATLHERRHTPIEDYPPIYQRCDAIVITSALEAGPMCLYEALASGVPVITTRCGWAEYLIQDGINGYLIDEDSERHMAEAIAHRMLDIASHRTEWFERRQLIAASLMGWSLESWIEDNVRLAMEVAR